MSTAIRSDQIGPNRIDFVHVPSRLGVWGIAATPRGVCAVAPLSRTNHGIAEAPLLQIARRHRSGYTPVRYSLTDSLPSHLREAVDALKHHLAGRAVDFSGPFDLAGTEFQQRVWQLLRKIPWGATTTYGQLAKALGAPTAARAVGQAVGANPACILVPCHRVVGKQGDLTGFAWGVELKAALLAMERNAHASSAITVLSSL